jgi:ribosomal protein S18 acetylase RimI-like enzyme
MINSNEVRDAQDIEIDQIAQIWFDGWHDAHAPIVPEDLTRIRTLDSFRDRIRADLSTVRVVGPLGAPLGFCMLKDNELYQLYVSAQARGSGAAAALMTDAEALLAARGVETGWLACAIGNDRAARFYEKCGWQRVGTVVHHAPIANGSYALEVWRYEKTFTH